MGFSHGHSPTYLGPVYVSIDQGSLIFVTHEKLGQYVQENQLLRSHVLFFFVVKMFYLLGRFLLNPTQRFHRRGGSGIGWNILTWVSRLKTSFSFWKACQQHDWVFCIIRLYDSCLRILLLYIKNLTLHSDSCYWFYKYLWIRPGTPLRRQ